VIVNLTPHPIRIYPPDTPDRIDPAEVVPTVVLPVAEDLQPARLGMNDLGTNPIHGIPVEYVEYGRLVHPLPDPQPEDGRTVWYVVPLVVALLLTYRDHGGRGDLLVPYLEVRNFDGTVVGCRLLARPV
jgi:hypothetical protein